MLSVVDCHSRNIIGNYLLTSRNLPGVVESSFSVTALSGDTFVQLWSNWGADENKRMFPLEVVQRLCLWYTCILLDKAVDIGINLGLNLHALRTKEHAVTAWMEDAILQYSIFAKLDMD